MLFISHKTEDKRFADEVRKRALQRGYVDRQIFLDSNPESGIGAGTGWESEIYANLKRTRAMIVLCSPNWLKSQWCFVELGYARAMSIAIFPVIIDPCEIGSTLRSLQSINLTNCADGEARTAEFQRLWDALDALHLGPHENLPWPPAGERDLCPFPGLMSFDEKHAPVYFGRERERDKVVQRLVEMRSQGLPRLLMIVGGSGSGKSSLLRAGVVPWLRHQREQQGWVVLPVLRYGTNPNEDVTLQSQLAEAIVDAYPRDGQQPKWRELRDQFEASDTVTATRNFVDACIDLCRAARPDRSPSQSPPTVLVAIDQFEELLSATQPQAVQFLGFLKALLSRSNSRLLVVATMRSDFLDNFENHPNSLDTPFLELYRLPPFPWDRIEDVIVEPARQVNVTLEPDLIRQLKADAPNSDALPLLAFTLEKLFRQCSQDQLLQLNEYLHLGGIAGAIQQSVAEIMSAGISREIEDSVRQVFVHQLARFSESGDVTRQTALWSEMPEIAKSTLEHFIKARLLRRTDDGKSIEVCHEAIFRTWPALVGWLNDGREYSLWKQRFRQDFEEWESAGRRTDYLLLGNRLQKAKYWFEGSRIFHPAERDFIEASLRLAQDTQRQFHETQAQRLSGQAELALQSDPRGSLKLASEAVRLTHEFELSERIHSEQILFRAILGSGGFLMAASKEFAPATWVREMVSRSDGQKLFFTGGGSVQVWSVNDANPRMTVELLAWHTSTIGAMAISPDDAVLVTGGGDKYVDGSNLMEASAGDGQCRALNLSQDKNLVSLDIKCGILSAAISGNSRWAAIGSEDGKVRYFNLKDEPPKVQVLEGHLKGVQQIAFSSDCRWLVTASRDGVILRWEATPDAFVNPIRLGLHFGQVKCLKISPDSRWVVTSGTDDTSRVWDLQKGEMKDPQTGQTFTSTERYSVAPVLWKYDRYVDSYPLEFSPDGCWLVTTAGENDVRLWNWRSDGIPSGHVQLPGFNTAILCVAFCPNSRWLFTGSWNRGCLWDVTAPDIVATCIELGAEGPYFAAVFTPDQRWLATGHKLGARLWPFEVADALKVADLTLDQGGK